MQHYIVSKHMTYQQWCKWVCASELLEKNLCFNTQKMCFKKNKLQCSVFTYCKKTNVAGSLLHSKYTLCDCPQLENNTHTGWNFILQAIYTRQLWSAELCCLLLNSLKISDRRNGSLVFLLLLSAGIVPTAQVGRMIKWLIKQKRNKVWVCQIRESHGCPQGVVTSNHMTPMLSEEATRVHANSCSIHFQWPLLKGVDYHLHIYRQLGIHTKIHILGKNPRKAT